MAKINSNSCLKNIWIKNRRRPLLNSKQTKATQPAKPTTTRPATITKSFCTFINASKFSHFFLIVLIIFCICTEFFYSKNLKANQKYLKQIFGDSLVEMFEEKSCATVEMNGENPVQCIFSKLVENLIIYSWSLENRKNRKSTRYFMHFWKLIS